MWGLFRQAAAAAAVVACAGMAQADAKWVRVGEEPAATPEVPPIIAFLFGYDVPVADPGGVVVRRGTDPDFVPWTYQPSKRKLVYGLPVLGSTYGVRRGSYVTGPDWTPYTGNAVRTPNGLAVTRPQRSVSGSLGASRVGRKVSRNLSLR